MAYSDFTLRTVQQKFEITEQRRKLFQEIEAVSPSAWLLATLAKSRKLVIDTEKARSELLVTPILLECIEITSNPFAYYSGQNFDVDSSKGLTGECDFILTQGQAYQTIHRPILMMMEAKKGVIEDGLGQCAAQMVGAQYFNQNEIAPTEIAPIYGCITTGEIWCFLRLENKSLTIDSDRYYIDSLPNVLGVMKHIIESFSNVTSKAK
jgi:hypothetical protein